MKTLKSMAATSFLALAFAAAAGAQTGPTAGMLGRGPQVRGIFNPVVGSGAQYEIQRNAGQDPNGKDAKLVMEIAVVGKDSVDGKDGYWFETVSSTPMGEMVMKMLMVPDGASSNVSRMIMQMQGRPPMEMPQMGRMAQQKQPTDIRGEADSLGSESVSTPAGAFAADHYRMKDGSGDFWLSEKVSPYGLIKYQGKDTTMVLTKVVTDAKDKITGTPVPFNPQMMMPGGQGPR